MNYIKDVPRFDNIVVSQKAYDKIIQMAETLKPSETSALSTLSGVGIVVGKWMPDDTMLLRLGSTIVAILQPDKRLKELDDFYKKVLEEIVESRS
jgi:hypothetical protein